MSGLLRPALISAALVVAGALSASARQTVPPPTPSPSPSKPQASRPPVRPADARPLDADDAWLIDEEGRRYRRSPLPKSQPHQKEGDRRLRTVWGLVVDLDAEDEENFYVKTYKTDDTKTGPVPFRPSPEAQAAVAASYAFNTPVRRLLAFTPFDKGLPATGQWRNGFDLVDMDGDGELDIVHPPARKTLGPPVIFRGNGGGLWTRWQDATFPAQRFDYGDVTVADFNGDGRPDLALAMHLLGVSVLLNEGDGRFRDGSRGMDPLGVESAFSSRALTTGDWDRDGRPDIFVLGEGPRLRLQGGTALRSSEGLVLYRNLPDGSWQKQEIDNPRPFGDGVRTLRLADGRTALAVASNNGGADKVLFALQESPWAAPLALDSVRPKALLRSVASADFDRDGADDLAIGYSTFELGKWRSGVDLMLQRPLMRTWERRTLHVEDGPVGFFALAAGNLSGDAFPDLVALSGNGRVLVFVASGPAKFNRESTSLMPATEACRGYHVEIADLDRDGIGDIVAGFAGEREGFAGMVSPGCPGEGSLRAWRVRPLPPPARKTAPPAPRRRTPGK